MNYRPRVFVSTKHPGDAVQHLLENADGCCSGSPDPITRDALLLGSQQCDAVVSVLADRFNNETFKTLPDLKVVANVAVGFDNVDVPAATANGVLVLNTPGVLDNTTADLAFALLLAVARRIPEADKYVRDKKWNRWTFDLLLGTDIAGKTLGIVGFGRIGQAMARRGRGFDMRIVYSQRNRAAAAVERQFEAEFVSLERLLAQSDFVSIHTPLTDQTRHMFSTAQFEQMKRGAFLINTARGAVVDEAALVEALQQKLFAGAGLDVFEFEPKVSAPLLQMPNVVLAPHIGSASVETRSAMARLAVDGLLEAFNRKLPSNAVNPAVFPKFLERLNQTVRS